MEGIVRELGGRKVIQFQGDAGKFTLLGVELEGREYNKTFVYTAGRVKDALEVGDIVIVGEGNIATVSPKVIPNSSSWGGVSAVMDTKKDDIIKLLTEIRDLLKDKKSKVVVEKQEIVKEKKPLNLPPRVELTPEEEYKDRCYGLREVYRHFPDEIKVYADINLPRIRELEKQLGIEKEFDYAK